MAQQGVIYKITSPTGRIYIGQTRDPKTRLKRYSNGHCKSQVRLYNSIKKYGFSQHKFIIIDSTTIEKLNQRERYWQDKYNVLSKKGLNCKLTSTEDLPCILSESTKLNISKGHKNNKKLKRKFTKEHINNLSKAASKPVINILTGEIYKSCTIAAKELDIKRTTLNAKLSGQNKNNTNLRYL